eukprot:10189217-Alexandrium_andersonii.AAC.1
MLDAVLVNDPRQRVEARLSFDASVGVDLVRPLVAPEQEYPNVEMAGWFRQTLRGWSRPAPHTEVVAVHPSRSANALQLLQIHGALLAATGLFGQRENVRVYPPR